MLNRIIEEYNPYYLAVAFDMKKRTFRHEIYNEYKAGRQETPRELLSQIPIMHDVLEAMNIAVLEMETYEADDIIGTVTKRASDEQIESIVITGDKDELQLIDSFTKVVINKKGMSEFDVYDKSAMHERYGIAPELFIDLKGLMGDSSDNIPGIHGIGEKKGLGLIKEYGSLEAVIENADKIKGKMGENVRGGVDSAILSKKLATIKRDVPIEFDLSDLIFREPDYQALISVYKSLEFNSFIKKLGNSNLTHKTVSSAENKFESELANVNTVKTADFYSSVSAGSDVVFEVIGDNAHLELPAVYGIAMFSPKQALFSISSGFSASEIISEFTNKNYSLHGNSIKESIYALMRHGKYDFNIAHDIAIAEYLIDPNKSSYSIDKMLLKYCGSIWNIESDSEKTLSEQIDKSKDKQLSISYDGAIENNNDKNAEPQYEYMRRKLFAISEIEIYQKEYLEKMKLMDVFEKCEMPLIEVIASMEAEGITVSRDILIGIGKELDKKIDKLKNMIYEEADIEFNIRSPKQLAEILFERMDIPYPNFKKGKSGYSTSADVLEKVACEHQIAAHILDYRKYTKLKSTYVDGIIDMIGRDGKIRPHFNQTVTATGRLSCTEPNLQNIPIKDDYGRSIRKAFIASSEKTEFIGADYSQIELRILAALSGDKVLIDAFNRGDDIHRLTASRVFDLPEDQVKPVDRSRAKAVNFGVIYGMSGFGLSEELGISRKEAQSYIDEYFQKHTAVKKYLDKQVETAKEVGEVRTILGRVRQITGFSSRKFTDRQFAARLAMNTPIQGSAADVIKMAMNSVYRELLKRKMKSKLVLQIHDELIIEAAKDEGEEVIELLDRNMRTAADLGVELICEINCGNTWYELK